jgi:hypothetical protein
MVDDHSTSNGDGGRTADDNTQEECDEYEEEEEDEEEDSAQQANYNSTPNSRTKKIEKCDSVVITGSYTQISQYDRELEEVSRIRTAGKYTDLFFIFLNM